MTAPAVVITGASSGIGREFSRLASAEGMALILIGRGADELGETVRLLGTQPAVYPLELDLTQPSAIQSIADLLAQHDLHCEILINSAGFGVFGPAAEASLSDQIALIDVNVRALVELCTRFLPGMLERRSGGIINVGSITGYAPGPLMATYCASKAFIRSYTSALAAEVRGSGVVVTALTPGVVRTRFFDRPTMRGSRLIKLLPRGEVRHTAEAGWRGFKRGAPIVVPRFIDRFIIGLCRCLPDRWLARLVNALQRA